MKCTIVHFESPDAKTLLLPCGEMYDRAYEAVICLADASERDNLHDRALTAELAAGVRRRRKQLDLRQDELADLAGSSQRFIHMLETGKPTVRLDKVLDVLQVLGLHLELRRGVAVGITVVDT